MLCWALLLSSLHDTVHLSLLHSDLILLLLLPLRSTASLEQLNQRKDGSSSEKDPVEGCKDSFGFHGIASRPVAGFRFRERLGHHDEAAEIEDGIEKFDDEMNFWGRGYCMLVLSLLSSSTDGILTYI
jgi:hypothetical protein